MIIGCDEVGYGALAGPLTVCGVSAHPEWTLEGLRDSKKLSDKQRHNMLFKLMKLVGHEIEFHVAERSNIEIDRNGLAMALKSAYVEVFHALHQHSKSTIIVDGNLRFDNLGVDAYQIQSIVKADTTVPQVMAASIIAKCHRDDKMKQLHFQYPNYNWRKNVGYGTADHLAGLNKYGPCPLHRFSYAPIKKAMKLPIL